MTLSLDEEHVEELAVAVHESGRDAVRDGLVLNKIPGQAFVEWPELPEHAKEGRRVQARWLIENGWVSWDEDEDDATPPPLPSSQSLR